MPLARPVQPARGACLAAARGAALGPPALVLRRRGGMSPGLVAGAAVLLAALGAAPARAAAPPPVAIARAPVVLAPLPQELRVLGKVDSLGQTTLVAPVTGRIVGPFLAGGQVAAGAVIARNLPPTLQTALASARAGVAFARAAAARTRQLVAQHLRTTIALDQAQRDLAQAEGRLDGLRQEAAQQVISAPFAGTLEYLLAPGTVVVQGTPVARLSGRATPWIDARLPPAAARQVTPGAAARIAASGWSGVGHVRSVGQDARPLGLVRVRIGLPAGNPLLPGEWVWVRLDRPGPPLPSVPLAAVLMRGAHSEVFVLRGGAAHAVAVRVLAAQAGRAWLAGPLHPNEMVATTHVTRLAEGSRVVLAEAPSGPAR